MASTIRCLVALGFAAAVAQAVLMREAMVVLAGSELAWGAVLATWLAGMALGARWGVRHGGRLLADAAPFLLPVAALAGVIVLDAAPRLAGTAPGEPVLVLAAAWLWPAAIFPAALLGGLGFPLLAGRLPGHEPAGTAYALEGLGAMAGGLGFSFVLAPWGGVVSLAAALALTILAVFWRPRPVLAVVAAVTMVAVAFPAGGRLEGLAWSWSNRPGSLAERRDTRQQRLELSSGEPDALYADGRLVASFPEPYLTPLRTHLLMLLHPAPRRVLAIGAAADGSLATILKHPVDHVDVVEEDPELLELLPRWFGPRAARALADPRVRLWATDPLRVVQRGGPWDLVLLLDGDPTTIRRNRTRTVEFLETCRERMAPGGVLALTSGVGDTYLGGAGGRLLAVEAVTVGRVFGRVGALPGEGVTLLASLPPHLLATSPEALAHRWRERAIANSVVTPALLRVLADPPRARAVEDHLRTASAPLNRATRPLAVLAATARSEDRAAAVFATWLLPLERLSPAVLPLLALLGVLVVALRARRGARLGVETAAVVGLSSLTWWLLLLAAWQATVGSVYAEVGALGAGLMAGLVAGAAVGRRLADPVAALPRVLALAAVLSAVLALGLPLLLPRLLVPCLLIAAGALTGAAFPGAARLAGDAGGVRRGTGLAFAADEAGAAVAALGVGLVALPWAGMPATAGAVAVLCGGTAATLAVARRRGQPKSASPDQR